MSSVSFPRVFPRADSRLAYRRLEDAGVTHIKTIPWPFYHGQTEDLDKKIDGSKRYADDVISQFD